MTECLIVTAEQWGELMRAIGQGFLIVMGVALFSRFSLSTMEWRLRRYLRRRRIARIRGDRNGR
ncbi:MULTISPECIES: hypothetical protein [Stenotrophomonas]|uniref:hypothetical protein n=1 Tax=Stenotrophomonas TaxID=40323 RepID=UPI001F321DB8|nr:MULTISPECIES: hypothetical protein [Stenotrophomonas]MCF3466342.1 hypothetical protein [Stenotrophomonas maltophilia]MCF3486364.1 hypothetical protein [Stenotrophomonas maltophilia]MCF3510787.1 hypothetical protein [Stenotrophomonas maltophilia]MDQ7271686.1 hypothetical protein [Stenotrophomonas sp. Sm3212]